MKAVRQARLELSGGSTPDQLKPPPQMQSNTEESMPLTLGASQNV